MMALLFLLISIIIILIGFWHRNIAIYLLVITLILSCVTFIHNISSQLTLSL